MRLYLVRHGKAEYGPVDTTRPLSARGRDDITSMAAHLAAMDVEAPEIFHSTLARARETAELFAAGLNPAAAPKPMEGIEPWGDVPTFAKAAGAWVADTMVCGHEPFMGVAASALLCGDPHGHVLTVKTGTVMALERGHNPSSWHLRWMLTPRMVRGPLMKDNA